MFRRNDDLRITQVRPLLPPAILIDAVTGPFGWIAVIKQHG